MYYKGILDSDNNIKETFLKDSIGRNEFLYRFISLLNSVDSSCVIALDSAWGNGKTFFVKQVKMILEEYYSGEEDKEDNEVINTFKSIGQLECDSILPIYYDAWENDNDDDPILSLIYQMLQEYDSLSLSKKGLTGKKIIQKFVEIVSVITDSPILKAINEGLKIEKADFLEEIKKQKELKIKIKDLVENILVEKGNKIVFLLMN